MKPGPVQYAWRGDVSLAYQIVGEGPIDLLVYFGWASNLDVQWESPYLAGFLQRLAGHARLIITDRRGWGCSDRFSPTTEVPAPGDPGRGSLDGARRGRLRVGGDPCDR